MSLIYAGIGAAIGVIGGRKGKKEDQAAADEAAELQRREAEMNWQATQEEVSRLETTHEEILKQAQVDVGAMGFAADSGSHAERMAQVETDFTEEREYMLETGESAKSIAEKNASLTSKYATAGSTQSTISAGFSGAAKGSQVAGWWTS